VYESIWLPNRDSYNDSDLYKVYIGICENHTGQNDLYNGRDLYKNCTNLFGSQMAPLFGTKFVPARAKQLPSPLYAGRVRTPKPHHTSQKKPTQHNTNQNTTPRVNTAAAASAPANRHRGRSPRCRRRRMTVRRHLTKQLHDPGSYKALCSAPPPHSGRQGRQQRGLGLGGLPPVVLRRQVHHGIDAALVVNIVVAIGGRRGGARRKEAHGIPGRGEEDEYRGRKVQCGVDEAQCGWEEEEGKSIGSRARDRVPGAGCELVRGRQR
jgi:hypothetical protein